MTSLAVLACCGAAEAQQYITYPPGTTPLLAANTGTTGAVSANLPAQGPRTTYLCAVDISAIGGTATVGPVTITGLLGGVTFSYQLSSSAAGVIQSLRWSPCIPGAANTAITVTTVANGTATGVDVNLAGYGQ